MLSINYLNFNYLVEYGFSLLLLNILIYITLMLLIFTIFFLFNIDKFRTLNEFKNFSVFNFIYMLLFINLVSLAGMPPLLGFLGKFLIIIFLFFKSQYFIFLIFFVINVFMIYFYIQNLRFMLSKTKSNKIIYLNYKFDIDIKNFIFLIFFTFFNLFSVFFFSDFLIILNNISLYINI